MSVALGKRSRRSWRRTASEDGEGDGADAGGGGGDEGTAEG